MEYLLDSATGHKRLSPCSMRSYAHFCLVQASLGLQPTRIEVRIKGFRSPLELASDITKGFCTNKDMLQALVKVLLSTAMLHLCTQGR